MNTFEFFCDNRETVQSFEKSQIRYKILLQKHIQNSESFIHFSKT